MTNSREPTLSEFLSDPVTRAMMQADGVSSRELEEMLRYLARLRSGSSLACGFRKSSMSALPKGQK